MEVFNVFGDEWNDEAVERPGGDTFKDGWIGDRLGSELLGGSLYEVPPHSRAWPYHYHHGNEELLIVVAGTPTVRTPNGERVLEPGTASSSREARTAGTRSGTTPTSRRA